MARSRFLTPFFAGLLWLIPFSVGAQDRCDQIFIKEGQIAESDVLLELESLNQRDFTPAEWQPLGFKELNLHDSYLIPLESITAVVKFGERVFEMEPLAYEIAALLNIDMPMTIPLRMGQHEGMAQVYRANHKTLEDTGQDIPINVVIRLFDRLTLQSDRHRENVLVDLYEPFEWAKVQTPIDHELIFNSGNKKVEEILRQGANGFLLENMQAIKKDYPEVHSAFIDPVVAGKIMALVEAKPQITAREVDYVKKFFVAYRSIAKLYESEAARPQNQ